MNIYAFSGRLTRDPEMRQTQNGKTVANFSVAVRENKDEVSFIDVTAWDKLADLIGKYCTKGKLVLVEGRIKQETWEKDGKRNSRHVVIANRVDFVSTGEGKPTGDNGGDSDESHAEETVVGDGAVVPF
jgi:single-strand DNA-binding protein